MQERCSYPKLPVPRRYRRCGFSKPFMRCPELCSQKLKTHSPGLRARGTFLACFTGKCGHRLSFSWWNDSKSKACCKNPCTLAAILLFLCWPDMIQVVLESLLKKAETLYPLSAWMNTRQPTTGRNTQMVWLIFSKARNKLSCWAAEIWDGYIPFAPTRTAHYKSFPHSFLFMTYTVIFWNLFLWTLVFVN